MPTLSNISLYVQAPSLDKVKMEVIRPKYFPMPPISVNAALNALELIDHPFYVFRNEVENFCRVRDKYTHSLTHSSICSFLGDE